MKKIILLLTFLFVAKTNFAQYNWIPMSDFGFGTNGSDFQFLQKHGGYLYSSVYNPNTYKLEVYRTATDTMNSFALVPSADLSGNNSVNSVLSTQSGGGFIYLGTSASSGGNVYSSNDDGTTWNEIFSDDFGSGYYGSFVRAISTFTSGGMDSLLLSLQSGYNSPTDYYLNNNTPIYSCYGSFFDSNGPSYSYNNYENYTVTIYPGSAGNMVRLNFSAFDTEGGYDYMHIYDGENTSATELATLNGYVSAPFSYTATNPAGAITVAFTSDNTVTHSGWSASISCVDALGNNYIANKTYYYKAALNASSNASWTPIDTLPDYAVGQVEFGNKIYALAKNGNLFRKSQPDAPWVDLGVKAGGGMSYTHLNVYRNKIYIAAQHNNGAMLWSADTSLSFSSITSNGFGNYGNIASFNSVKTTPTAIYLVGNGTSAIIWKSVDGNAFYTINNDGFGGQNDGIECYVEEFGGKVYASGNAAGNNAGARVWSSCVPPSAQINYSGSTSVCFNSAKTFTAIGGAVNYNWYVNDSLYQSGTDTVFTPAEIFNNAGSYLNISLAVAGSQCGDSTGVQFYVNNPPYPVDLLFNETTICANSSIDIEEFYQGGKRTMGGSYAHVFDSNMNDLGTLPYTVTPLDTEIYYVANVNYDGCLSEYDTVTINTFALPNVQIAASVIDFCIGDSVSLSVSGASSYYWNNGDTATIVYAHYSNNFIVSGIDSNGCSNQDTVMVAMHQKPIVNVGNDPTICAGQSVNLNAAAIYAVSGSWSPTTGLSNPASSATAAGPDTTTTYIYTAVTAYGCTYTDTITVNINPYPTPDINGPDTVCGNASGISYSTPFVTGNTYNWNVTGGNIVSGQGTHVVIVNWANGTNGTLNCTEATSLGCALSTSMNVLINSVNPVITPSSPACAGAAGLVYSVPVNTGSTYAWNVAGGVITSGQGTDAIIVNWNNGALGNVAITETSSAGCSANNSVNITLTSPSTTITPNTPVCAGATNVVYAAANHAGSSYSWSIAGGTIISGENTDSIIVNWNNGAVGNLTVTETTVAGCIATASVNITLTSPSTTITPNTPVCAGATNVPYTAANHAGSSYSWTIAGGTITSGQSTDSITVNWNNGAVGNLTVTETTVAGCIATASVNITLTSPSTAITPGTAVCAGATNVVYTVPNNSGSTYNWTVTGGTLMSGQNSNSITVNWGNGAFGNITVSETTTGGCSATASVNITLSAPSPSITPSGSACAGASGLVYAVTNNSGSSYNWTIAGGAIAAGQNTNSVTVNWNNGVIGNIAVTETGVGGCSGTSSVNITLTAPIVSAGSDVSICNGASANLSSTFSGAAPLTLLWTPSNTLNSATISNPVATPNITTNYTLTVTDANGCIGNDQVLVNVISPYSLLTGNVQFDSIGVNKIVKSGTVKAFSADSAGLIYPVSIAPIQSNGNYTLYGVPAGNYKIFVEPNAVTYPYLTNAYYNDAILWEDATPISFACGDTVNQTIDLTYIAPVVGTANISGRILADASYEGKTTVQGDPVPGVDVSLEQNPGSVMLATTTTDNNGYFNFTNIPATPAGFTYVLLVNIPGFGLDSTYQMVVGPGESSVHNDYLVSDSVVYIDSVLSATLNGVKTVNKADAINKFESYPNPYQHETTLNYSLKENGPVKLEVYNTIGQKIETIVNANQTAGNYKYKFSARNNGYSSGVYYARLTIGDQTTVIKLVEL